MSTVYDYVDVAVSVQQAVSAIRSASRSFGSCAERGNNSFAIKDNTPRTQYSTSWPATVTIELESINNDNTRISFTSSNFGFGRSECESRLGAVKAAVLSEMDSLQRKNAAHIADGADAMLKYKQLLDAGIITQDEYNMKKHQLLGL